VSAALPPVAILAGGLATRLRPVTAHIPKSLLLINGKPFLEHQLELLASQGVRRVVLCAGFLGDQIVEAIGDGRRFGLDVAYSFDGPVLLGTGGAIRRALPVLDAEAFFVLYGDSYLECDYGAVHRAWLGSGRSALMTVFENDGAWDQSNVCFEDGTIRAYSKRNRTPAMKHIDYGLGLVRAAAFEEWPTESFDLSALYEQLAQTGELAAYEARQRFFEIGSRQGIADLSEHLRLRERCV
jgi:N-acetyl-alpha-D-muramate 1-phosphate uridylyltransferase